MVFVVTAVQQDLEERQVVMVHKVYRVHRVYRVF
jgi:hypothetical protein